MCPAKGRNQYVIDSYDFVIQTRRSLQCKVLGGNPMESKESEQLDPRAALDLIADTRTRARRALEVNGGLLYAAYGVVWLSVRGHPIYRTPSAWTFVVMGACMAAALAVSMITIGRAMNGVTGSSSTSGKLYGWAWAISFICLFFIIGGLGHAGASVAVIGLFASAGPALVVSFMYLVSGALWNNRTMFAVGAWLALTSGVAVIFGVVTFDLLIALVGGGGFLVAALYEARRKRS
jgi:uncharacterized membrane protein